MAGPRTSVSIAGAHDIVAGGLRALLGSASDVEILCEPPPFGTRPDVVVYDAIGVEPDGGAELFALIKDSECPVLVLGRDLRPDLAARAMAHGAAGCFSIESDGEAVLTMIRQAASGGLEGGSSNGHRDVLGAEAGLSPREVQVLGAITKGASNQEISALLALSANTIKSYIRSAYRKIDVDNRSQAVAWCLLNGFEPPGR